MFRKTIIKQRIVCSILFLLFTFCENNTIVSNIEEENQMEIIDVLMNRDVAAPKFTVNTAVNSVALSYDGTLQDALMSNDDEKEYFQNGDNWQILSVGYVLPLSFEIYKVSTGGGATNENVAFQFQTIDRLVIVETLNPGFCYIPLTNYEMALGIYYEHPKKEIALRLQMRHDIEISMINVPAALNGLEFRVPVFAKVLHNLPLIN